LASQNQGLGFTVMGVVLDQRYVASFCIKLVGVTVSAITALLALRPAEEHSRGEGVCELGSHDREAFMMMASMINRSCTYNISVGPAGVIDLFGGL
jgi:hypothetical protein